HKTASRVAQQAVCQSWFSLLPIRRKQSLSRRINLPPTSDFLYQESDNHKQRVENPNANGSLLGRQWIARHVRITYLDDNESDSENDHSSFTNRWHHISRQVKDDSDGK